MKYLLSYVLSSQCDYFCISITDSFIVFFKSLLESWSKHFQQKIELLQVTVPFQIFSFYPLQVIDCLFSLSFFLEFDYLLLTFLFYKFIIFWIIQFFIYPYFLCFINNIIPLWHLTSWVEFIFLRFWAIFLLKLSQLVGCTKAKLSSLFFTTFFSISSISNSKGSK